MVVNSMKNKLFSKNDNEFECVHCGAFVERLNITSRNHCNFCLHSLHVDLNPGDRQNPCRGVLTPYGIAISPKKGYIIKHRCSLCKKEIQNKSAPDDNIDLIIKLSTGER